MQSLNSSNETVFNLEPVVTYNNNVQFDNERIKQSMVREGEWILGSLLFSYGVGSTQKKTQMKILMRQPHRSEPLFAQFQPITNICNKLLEEKDH